MKATLLEIALVVFMAACGLMLFFGPVIESRFAIYPGDLADWRFNGVIAEHWFAVLTGREQWRDMIFFFPVKGILGYSDALFLFAPFYLPFRAIGIGPSLAFVFCFMSILAFGFLTAYWFMTRTLAFPRLIALGLSFAFVFSNMAAMRYPHAQLYSSCFLPMLFAMGLPFAKSVVTQRAAILPGVGFSVGLAALVYTGFYIGYFVILFLVCFIPIFALLSGWCVPGSTREMGRALWRARYVLVVCLGSFAIALVPFVLTYLPVLKEVGGRDWGMVSCMLPLPRDFINVDSNGTWGWLQQKFPPETRPCGWELTFGFPLGTYALFIFATIWLLWALRRRLPTRERTHYGLTAGPELQTCAALAAALAVVFCWLAMLRLGAGSLWYLIYTFVPGASAIRAVFRFQEVLYFFVLIVIGFSLSRVAGCLPRRAARAVMAVAAMGVAAEQYNGHHLFFAGRVHAAELDQIHAPPRACRQFFVDPEAIRNQPSSVGNLDAVIVAQRFGLSTFNGYTASPPNGVNFTEFDNPLYLANVADWAYTHSVLNGLCILDLGNKSWEVLSERLAHVENELIGSNLIDFKSSDPMAVFAFRRTGFDGLEPSGVWTNGDARIAFSASIGGVKTIVVSGHRGYAGQNVSVAVGDRKIIVDPGVTVFTIEVPVTRPVSWIDISADSFVPAAMGLGPDTRRLGAFLETVVLKN